MLSSSSIFVLLLSSSFYITSNESSSSFHPLFFVHMQCEFHWWKLNRTFGIPSNEKKKPAQSRTIKVGRITVFGRKLVISLNTSSCNRNWIEIYQQNIELLEILRSKYMHSCTLQPSLFQFCRARDATKWQNTIWLMNCWSITAVKQPARSSKSSFGISASATTKMTTALLLPLCCSRIRTEKWWFKTKRCRWRWTDEMIKWSWCATQPDQVCLCAGFYENKWECSRFFPD